MGLKASIEELIQLTKNIAEYTGEANEEFLLAIEHRNELFENFQSLFDQYIATIEESSNQEVRMDQSIRVLLQELYTIHKQAETVIEAYKKEAAEQIKKIEKGKQTSDLYEQGRGRNTARRNPYQATPDAAFFDKKK